MIIVSQLPTLWYLPLSTCVFVCLVTKLSWELIEGYHIINPNYIYIDEIYKIRYFLLQLE